MTEAITDELDLVTDPPEAKTRVNRRAGEPTKERIDIAVAFEGVTESRIAKPAPVVVRAVGWSTQRTLGVDAVRLMGGIFGVWQQANRDISIPEGIRQLERAGNLDNVRRARAAKEGAATVGEFRGPIFMDSDIYKQLEAAAWESVRGGRSPQFTRFVDETAALLAETQLDDGYLNSYYQSVDPASRYSSLASSHELYCAGHLIQAAVAAKRAGMGDALLDVATKFADHLVATFGDGLGPGIDGHPEIETALVELYRSTGDRRYLSLAATFLNGRGQGRIAVNDRRGRGARYLQDHLSVRDAPTLVGHAVRALYLEAAVVDLYLETGDRSLLNASLRRWEDMVASKTYLTGGLGSRHSQEAFGDAFELPPDRAYAETCASIASIQWSWRLLLATGESRFADLIERTLYNVFAASTSVSGDLYFYVNPLQRRTDHFEADDPGRRKAWYDCACCPPNIMRLIASLSHYVASYTDGRILIHQYLSAHLEVPLPAGSVTLAVESDLPWGGRIVITVEDGPEQWELALRAPSWAGELGVTVNGADRKADPNDQGYLIVTGPWRAGDRIEISFGMDATLVVADHRIDAVRSSAAITRGPLVYCVEQTDQPDVRLDDVQLVGSSLGCNDTELPGIGRTVVITTAAVAISRPQRSSWPYMDISARQSAAESSEEILLTAVPYFQWDNRGDGSMRVWLPRHRLSSNL